MPSLWLSQYLQLHLYLIFKFFDFSKKRVIMAGWHVVEKYLEETGLHSTLIGKYWITMFLVLRLLILFSICEAAFGDVGLECDTKTPGCE